MKMPAWGRWFLLVLACGMVVLGAVQLGDHYTAIDSIPKRHASAWVLIAAGLLTGWWGWRWKGAVLGATYVRRLFLGILASYLVVLFTVGGQAGDGYIFRLLASVWVAGLTACYRFVPTSASGRAAWWRTALSAVDLIATNLALILVLGEVSLRGYVAVTGDSPYVQSGWRAWKLPPNRDHRGLFLSNSLGYADEEFQEAKSPEAYRVAALGDSFAVGVVSQEHNYLTLLERLGAHTEVYNFGVVCTGPSAYLDILETEVWSYQPDYVLVSFFVGNDCTEELPTRGTMPPHDLRLVVFIQRLCRLSVEELTQTAERSPRRGEGRREEARRKPKSPRGFSRETHLRVEVGRLTICRPSAVAELEPKWARSLASMDGIFQACRRRGVPVGVVLIPDEFQIDSELLQEMLDFAGIAPDDVDLELPQRRLTAFCAQRGVPCLDLLPALKDVKGAYFPRDTHWNEKGNRIAADHIAAWLGVR
jgi:hypothetical protein